MHSTIPFISSLLLFFVLTSSNVFVAGDDCTPDSVQWFTGNILLGEVSSFNDSLLIRETTLSQLPSMSTELSMSLIGTSMVNVQLNDQTVGVYPYSASMASLDVAVPNMRATCGANNVFMISAFDRTQLSYGSSSCALNWQITVTNPDC